MKIVPNSLLKPTEKCIKVWNCSYIAVEGPNVTGNLSLEDIAIPYTSQYRSRLVLNANSIDQPLLYGFLGQEVTFLMIKVTYDEEHDQYYRYEKEKYNITYYYENENTLRPIGRLLTLTGSDTMKIPQIYLNNPYENDVFLDVLMATLEQDDISVSEIQTTTFTNLYYSNVISNESFVYGVPYTGSSQLVVLNDESNPILYIPYSNISLTELDITNKKIIITTTLSDQDIVLKFLTDFDTYQTYSRISWVRETDGISEGAYRFLTTDYIYYKNIEMAGVDTVVPDIYYYSTSGTTIPSDLTLPLVHLSGVTTVTGWTEFELRLEIISGVTDNWDGNIDDVSIQINKLGSVSTIEEITTVGTYRIIFRVSDIANNIRTDTINNIYVT